MSLGRSLCAALVLAVALVHALPWGINQAFPPSALAQQATPAAPSPGDPCAAIVAAGTPSAEANGGAMGALDPIPGEQTGELGNPADYPFDLIFLDARIGLHQSAIALAEIALARAEREESRSLARDLVDRWNSESAALEAWRAGWFPGADRVPTNVVIGLIDEGLIRLGGPADMGNAMGSGPAATATADGYRLCTTVAGFDLAFAEIMISYQQRAIGLSLLAQERAEHPDLRAYVEASLITDEALNAQLITRRDELSAATSATPNA